MSYKYIHEIIGDKIPINHKVSEKTSVGLRSCGVCGGNVCCYDILSNQFTNIDQLSSCYICAGCSRLFDDNYRKTGFYITEQKAVKLKQAEYADLLFTGNITVPCLISFSESRKKHRLFRTKLTTDPRSIKLSLDDGEVIFNSMDGWELKVFKYLQKLYGDYKLAKNWLYDFPTHQVQKTIGVSNYLKLVKMTKPHLDDIKYKLIISFLNDSNTK